MHSDPPDTGRASISPKPAEPQHPGRRDLLTLTTGLLVGCGACAAAAPFIDSLTPPGGGGGETETVDVDLSRIAAGQQHVVVWQGKPVFVLHRTEAELALLQAPATQLLLRDPDSAAPQQPAYASNWHRSIDPRYAVLIGVCTHLGCVPSFRPEPAPGWPGGYGCPCHGSQFDLAGRVFVGAPAPYNLPVPPHSLPKPGLLRIGQNPPGQHYDLGSVKQI